MKLIVTMVFVFTVGILISGSTNVEARDFYCNSSGHSFSSQWTETKTKSASTANYPSNYITLKYGYNTTLINEDYAHAKALNTNLQARVINNSGTFTSTVNLYSTWAKIEVTHNGTYIQYGAVNY